ncbi:hypothetical protein BHM03_00004227 [Ensete ventricosum]|uniref:Uncharacterized protein n=1 Tax=Ensete ventricosum TaxID=4639 RepID=A0A445MAF9_ENSVE|nr:hypothetical protein BHM03_00004227 [Ensete ventricosum]
MLGHVVNGRGHDAVGQTTGHPPVSGCPARDLAFFGDLLTKPRFLFPFNVYLLLRPKFSLSIQKSNGTLDAFQAVLRPALVAAADRWMNQVLLFHDL